MENIFLKILGIILILIPIFAIISLILTDNPVPVIGSPFVMIIFWIIGAYLIIYKKK